MSFTTPVIQKDHYIANKGILSFYDDNLFRFVKTYITIDWSNRIKAISTEDTSWFWSKEWQTGEKKANEDLKKGRFTDHETIDDVISFLHAQKKIKK